jgi:hypothetical protein
MKQTLVVLCGFADKESNWLPAPNRHFSLYIRAYWGQQGILDGSWQPPIIRKVK